MLTNYHRRKSVLLLQITWLSLCFASRCLVSASAGPALATPTKADSGFSRINNCGPYDWIAYNADSNKLAVVQTTSIPDHPRVGISLSIYEVDKTLQPVKLLFTHKQTGQYITELEWVGSTLFYPTIKGVPEGELPNSTWLKKAVGKEGLAGIVKHLHLGIWPKEANKGNLVSLRCPTPGNIFSFGSKNDLYVFDSLDALSKNWDADKKWFRQSGSQERTLEVYNISTGKLKKIVKVKLPPIARRWWEGRGNCLPVALSNDASKMLFVVSSNFLRTDGPALVYVDLGDGSLHMVSSDSRLNGLRLWSGAEPHYFKPGNPMLIPKGQEIVCQLSMTESTSQLAFHFGFFNWGGTMVENVPVLYKNLQQAGAEGSLLITWTTDGQRLVLQTGKDIRVANYSRWKSNLLARNVWVEDVVGWVNKQYLLVRAKQIQKGSDSQTSQSELTWGLLRVPTF